MTKRRKRSRRLNPQYSDSVFEIANNFIEVLESASMKGLQAAQKIDVKAGDVKIARMINKLAIYMGDAADDLDDELNG